MDVDHAVKARATAMRESERAEITILETPANDDGRDVAAGLIARPKTLPCRYFYDEAGSALFERICDLPEYYPTRTEEGILRRAAPEIAALSGASALIELGSGSARKTRLLIDAFTEGGRSLSYRPVDVSGSAVEASAADLLADYSTLRIQGLIGTYERAFEELARQDSPRAPLLVLFLGSTIGNFTPDETETFLARLRRGLRAGDGFLVGIDLRKDVDVIEAAYDDSAGVTAAFNRNILSHINRLFGGNFAPERFEHLAFYDREAHRIEMHLKSRIQQTARLDVLDLGVAFEAGETIRTEISRKFDRGQFSAVLEAQGFQVARAWTDERDWFALLYARAA